ncbi:Kelch-type beta propeller [Phytophthora cactorum]|nr:Kelch-type beta propeller [Phytophthora cactorum]
MAWYSNPLLPAQSSEDLEELHEFKIARRSWSVVPIHGEAPLRRKDYSVVLYRDNFYVFGGMRVPDYRVQNDIVKYNFTTAASNGQLPAPRSSHPAVVYGGNFATYILNILL